MKGILLCGMAIFLLVVSPRKSNAQPLVTYGDQQISKEAFLNAYQKNNSSAIPTEKSYRDYLKLYINYRLKVRAALDLRLDTLPNQLTEVQNFRSQIVDQYVNDVPSVNRLVAEAFKRSQRDIHIQHIFISAPKLASPADTMKAYKKAQQAYADLKKGRDFGETAAAYSEDPFAKTNKGDLGFITVFNLPYALETLAYDLGTGKISKIYRGPGGYHIFKNLGDRKPLGKIRVAQILLVFPQNADAAARAATKGRADSLYQALLAGADFSSLARKFSGDNLSFQTGGEMAEFGIGKYDPAFESAAFALAKDGDVSPPVETVFGYHLLKRIKRRPVPITADKKYMDLLRDQVMSDPRIEIAKKEMLVRVTRETGIKDAPVNEGQLWAMTDSALQNKKIPVFAGLSEQSPLFSFPDKIIYVRDWLNYRKSLRSAPSLTSGKTQRQLLDQYRQTGLFDYYKNHLERYNRDFAYQVEEFRDGNLLFEIMQRKVWDRASMDSAGLRQYFENHAGEYSWNPGAEAILFTTGDQRKVEMIQTLYKNSRGNWRKIQDSLTGQLQTDSGRFELKQLPGSPVTIPGAGQFTAPAKNPDQTVQFAFIIRTYPEKMARNFEEARGLAINDYQNFLDSQWLAELAQKYPVKINETVFKTLKPSPAGHSGAGN
jgi:peptidyl-prolyl cis-trans isomerase SurA